MNFDNPITWSFLVTMCSIALLTQGAVLVHVLFMTRQSFQWYLLPLVLFSVSYWSFNVALHTSNEWEYHSLVPHLHISPAFFYAKAAPLIFACQLQIAITITIFAIMLIVRITLLPRTNQPPVWTLSRERLFRVNGYHSGVFHFCIS
jgi:hypothetical protein